MRIVAYKTTKIDGKVLLEESGGQQTVSGDPEELFSFLLEPYEDTIRVCWNLDSTISLILGLLGEETCRKLRERKRA